jgi:hypothetical protein
MKQFMVNGRPMTYGDYLRSDEWNETRRAAITRANFRCQMCCWQPRTRTYQGFHVHHNTYENLGHEKPEDLIALCKDCHRRFHRKDNGRHRKGVKRRGGWSSRRMKKMERKDVKQTFWREWNEKRNHLVCVLLDRDPKLPRVTALSMANQMMSRRENGVEP